MLTLTPRGISSSQAPKLQEVLVFVDVKWKCLSLKKFLRNADTRKDKRKLFKYNGKNQNKK